MPISNALVLGKLCTAFRSNQSGTVRFHRSIVRSALCETRPQIDME